MFGGQSLADGLLDRVDPTVRPAVQDLVYGSLRAYGYGDFQLARLLARPLDTPEVHALLLVALYRLETRPDAAHTVVDQAVVAAGERGTDLAVRLGYASVPHTLVHNTIDAITSCPKGHVEVVANYTAFLQLTRTLGRMHG